MLLPIRVFFSCIVYNGDIMLDFLNCLNPVLLALFGGLFSFLFTSLGAAVVFLFKRINRNIMDSMISLAAGIMLAASFFSLLNPAIEICNELKQNIFLTVFLGFIVGGGFILVCNSFFKTLDFGDVHSLRKSLLLFTSITLHNIPEGLAIGVAFGNMFYGGTLVSAIILTIGIAVQNFPEGSAISLPIRREGVSRLKSFLFGFASGIVEPISAIIGAILVMKVQPILPFILSFAAGAMIFVVSYDLIPDSQTNKRKDLMAFILILGFSFMMILELILG